MKPGDNTKQTMTILCPDSLPTASHSHPRMMEFDERSFYERH